MIGEEIQAREYNAAIHAEENETVEKYIIPEPQQQVLEPDERMDETSTEEPTVSYPNVMTTMRDPPPAPAEEPVGEPPKQTYASIVCLCTTCLSLLVIFEKPKSYPFSSQLRAKGQPGYSAPHPASVNKTAQVASDRQHAPQLVMQLSQPAVVPEKSSSEALEESSTFEYEGTSSFICWFI